MRHYRNILAIVAVTASMIVPNSAKSAGLDAKSITIGTSPAGSLTFLLGNGFAKLFQEKLKVKATAQPHAGSTVYLGLVDKGEMTLGLGNGIDTADAYSGIKPYSHAHKGVRLLASVWVIPLGFIVKANSGINTAADLKGKRVVTQVKPVRALAGISKAYIESAGLTLADVIQLSSGGLSKSVDMVVQGRADAAPIAIAAPIVRKAHATVPGGVRIIPLGKMASDAFMQKRANGSRTLNVKGNAKYVPNDMMIAAFDTNFNIGANVTVNDAYFFAKTLHQNWKAMQKAYAPLRRTNAEQLAAASNGIPFHEGAIKYYKEAGIWTAANDKQQAAVK